MYPIIKNISKSLIAFAIVLLSFAVDSCKKFVEVPPPAGIITSDGVFASNATAISVLTALYSSMNSSPIQGSGSITMFAGMSADEFTLNGGITNPNYIAYYQNNLQQTAVQQYGADHWNPLYSFVFKCNAAIEGLEKSKGLDAPVKQQLLGESKFMRAFFYFYLVNEFGDVPLALTTDPQKNTLLSRSTKTEVFQQITTDLEEAVNLLSANFLDGTLLNTTFERTRPNKWAAQALLARAYLYSEKYSKAESAASAVISNNVLFDLLPALNDVFVKNSREAIWQIQPINSNFNTLEAQSLIITSSGPTTGGVIARPVYLSNQLLNSFETGDQRAVNGNWINAVTVAGKTYRFPYKYKINSSPGVNSISGLIEYFMALRLSEQYLIRAEARAMQGNVSGAQMDLNMIRNRAGLSNYSGATDQTSLLAAIFHEKQVELFSEWGHRWFDLKRTGKVDAVMTVSTPQKSNGAIQWQSYKQLYPLPITELQRAPNLKQNPNY